MQVVKITYDSVFGMQHSTQAAQYITINSNKPNTKTQKPVNTPVVTNKNIRIPYKRAFIQNDVKKQSTESSDKKNTEKQIQHRYFANPVKRKAHKKEIYLERNQMRQTKQFIQDSFNTIKQVNPVYSISIRPHTITVITPNSARKNTVPFMVFDIVSEETR